jgi:hypothetical protein
MPCRAPRLLIVTLALTLVALPAAAEKVFVDYDPAVDFSTFETFSYSPAKKGLLAQDERTDQRIVDDILEHLEASGLRRVEVDAEPDVVIAYQLAVTTEHRADITAGVFPVDPMWGSGWEWGPTFGPGWAWDGLGWATATTMVSAHRSGTLMVAAFDASTRKGIWRGTAEIEEASTPYKTHQRIDKALDKMAEKWRQMHERD